MTLRGTVNAKREAVVRLRIRGPRGSALDVDAVVDTGFAGSLSLPTSVIDTLGLPKTTFGGAKLGDGSLRRFDVHVAEVDLGLWQPVLVAGIGREALIGMRLLAGHRLCVDVTPGGAVEVEPLP